MSDYTATIYGLTRDLGAGSSTVCWFRDLEVVNNVLSDDSDQYVDEFYGNDGSPAITLTFPADLDLKACGFKFSDDRYRKE